MLTALQRHFAIISSKVRKLQQEQEWSVSLSTVNGQCHCLLSTAGQTMTETEVFISQRNIRSDGASPTAVDRLFNAHFQSFMLP